jgi:hypothetical protein
LRKGSDATAAIPSGAEKHAYLEWVAKNEAAIHQEAAEKTGAECLPHTVGFIDSWCESVLPQSFYPQDVRDTSPDEKTKAKLDKKTAERLAVRLARDRARRRKRRAANKIRQKKEIDGFVATRGWKLCKDETDMYYDPTTKAVFRLYFLSGLLDVQPEQILEHRAPDLCVPKPESAKVGSTASDGSEIATSVGENVYILPSKPASAKVGSTASDGPMTSVFVGKNTYITQFRAEMDEAGGTDRASTMGANSMIFNSREDVEEAAADLPHFAGLLDGVLDLGGPPRRKGKLSSDSSAQDTLQPGDSPSIGKGAASPADAPCNYRCAGPNASCQCLAHPTCSSVACTAPSACYLQVDAVGGGFVQGGTRNRQGR